MYNFLSEKKNKFDVFFYLDGTTLKMLDFKRIDKEIIHFPEELYEFLS